MAKILLAFHNGIYDENNPNAYPVFYDCFVSKLKEYGNELLVFQNRMFGKDFGDIDDDTRHKIEDFNPDVCFLFNNCFFPIHHFLDCPIVIYEVDSPRYYSNKSDIIKNPDRFCYFIKQSTSAPILIEEYGISDKNIYYIPLFSEVKSDNKIEQTTNICFIGSLFYNAENNVYGRFIREKPTRLEREQFGKIIESLKVNPFVTKDVVCEKYHIDSELVRKYMKFGQLLLDISAEKRIHILSNVTELGLNIYGDKLWRDCYYLDSQLNYSYKDEVVYSLEHNQKIYNQSRIGLSVSHVQAVAGYPWRILDIMASNSCLVSDFHEDLYEDFPELKDIIPLYDNPVQVYNVCKDLLDNEDKRLRIVKACNEVVDERYRFVHCLRIIENYLEIDMNSKNEKAVGIL